MGDASEAGIALHFLVAGGRVGVEGKAVYEVSLGVGDDGGTVTVVAELLKKLKTDNCLCIFNNVLKMRTCCCIVGLNSIQSPDVACYPATLVDATKVCQCFFKNSCLNLQLMHSFCGLVVRTSGLQELPVRGQCGLVADWEKHLIFEA